MKILTFLLVFCFAVFVFYLATHQENNSTIEPVRQAEATTKFPEDSISLADLNVPVRTIAPKVEDTVPVIEVVAPNLHPDTLVNFAETLIGIPYKYASTDPSIGFDCSGFVTYVFNHFDVKVPRSTRDFENTGTEIPLPTVRRGDLILFTGTDSTERIIGHMGIIVSNDNGKVKFIHSTSGKAYGVTITDYNKYYQGRFVKTIRVLHQPG